MQRTEVPEVSQQCHHVFIEIDDPERGTLNVSLKCCLLCGEIEPVLDRPEPVACAA
jgi:hypothetical protein